MRLEYNEYRETKCNNPTNKENSNDKNVTNYNTDIDKNKFKTF